jgi:dTDP-4-amino-4,6-dideoxy-D-galactose acyltransferase
MRVAREMRNSFDRFHADPVFGQSKADEFLATYIEQSVKGFADIVLVPDEPGVPPDSFLTARYLKDEWEETGYRISKMVLSAVSSATNKGWYSKLIGAMTRHLQEEGAQYIHMNTQATNGAVIHTWESLGYRFGYATHVLSFAYPS